MLNREHIARSDNLRILGSGVLGADRERQISIGAAALRFIDSVERGTAIIPAGIAIQRGSRVYYRAIGGEMYDAKIVAVASRHIGRMQNEAIENHDRVVLDIMLPGVAEPVRLTDVVFKGVVPE